MKVRPHIAPSNPAGEEIIVMMQNAVTETSLVSFRCLNEFLRTKDGRHWKDDVSAEDYFGYKTPGPFLSDIESSHLNKRLLHLTYQDEALDTFGWTESKRNYRIGTLCWCKPPSSRLHRIRRASLDRERQNA